MSPNHPLSRSAVCARNFVLVGLLVFTAAFVYGQRRGMANLPPKRPGDFPAFDLSPNDENDGHGKPGATESACFLPPLNSMAAGTIGVVDLQVPWKAKTEYQNGCAALRKNKVADAEKHLRKAVLQYEKYAAAWVLLGQVLENQKKPDEARDACSRSLNASASYLAGYLCLTDISTRQKNWEDALKFSAHVLELDSTTNAIAYAYYATANLHLNHVLEAEKSALRALQLDVRNSEPRIHFVLAQVYAAKGDRSDAAAQLHDFLKYARDPDDIALVTKILAKLDTPAAK
jgi:tetratricopeptide (TPR) repeat protein